MQDETELIELQQTLVQATFDEVASLEQVRMHVESWLQGVMERRARMGKA
jgi:hypothetical protein